jgi:hypothetical protein
MNIWRTKKFAGYRKPERIAQMELFVFRHVNNRGRLTEVHVLECL